MRCSGQSDPRVKAGKQDYLNDLAAGTLPQVSWIIPDDRLGWDEHPPADISVGMNLQRELITALQQSSAWASSVYLLTYDESGGFFDHVAPPQLDAYGPHLDRQPDGVLPVLNPFAVPWVARRALGGCAIVRGRGHRVAKPRHRAWSEGAR